jgi:hypothetical protein
LLFKLNLINGGWTQIKREATKMGFTNIDAPGNAVNRRGVRAIQRAAGSSDRQAAAKARREAKAAKRAREAAKVKS